MAGVGVKRPAHGVAGVPAPQAQAQAALGAYLAHVQAVCPRLSAADVAFFARGLQVRALPARAFLRRAGEAADSLFYVSEGLLKVFYEDENGGQTNINFLQAGQYAGDYSAFVSGRPCQYSFQCLEDCTLLGFSRAHQAACSEQIPAIEGYFRKMVEAALLAYLRRTERLLVADARTRYVEFLQDFPDLHRRVSVSDLCSFLGVQRQTLTRIRQQLRRPAV